MRKIILLSAAIAVVVGFFGLSAARAAVINVPNFSFENPPGPYTLPVSLTIDDWTTTGPPGSPPVGEQVDVGNGSQNSGVGIFSNNQPGTVGYATNGDGSNLAYMYSGYTGADTYKLHTLYQLLSTPFSANTRYTLTVGASDAGSLPPPGDQLSLQLYYTADADPSTPIFLAARNIVQGVDPLSQTALTDYSATLSSLSPSDPAVGNDIGIIFTTSGVGGGEYNLDNVRLTTSPAPEPGSLVLVGSLGAAGLMCRRRNLRAR
ncbi:MAG TPA: PEP-CTERM sorting domain-containing protein [Tepidisphaeraceae bacterium]|nr:PEP-CTERM sorting domain-containing protein [Tepidisphaeraceae bacterium]